MQISQSTTVSWSVDHGRSTMDLLTLDNVTFSGDSRFSVVRQNPTNWALVIDGVEARDAGKYICTLETFPKQSLIVYLQVDGQFSSVQYSSVPSLALYLNTNVLCLSFQIILSVSDHCIAYKCEMPIQEGTEKWVQLVLTLL